MISKDKKRVYITMSLDDLSTLDFFCSWSGLTKSDVLTRAFKVYVSKYPNQFKRFF